MPPEGKSVALESETAMKTSRFLIVALFAASVLANPLRAPAQPPPASEPRHQDVTIQSDYNDIKGLLLIRYLQLTDDQAQAIAPLATALAMARTVLNGELDKLYDQGAQALQQQAAAWAAGNPPRATERRDADAIMDRYHDLYDALDAGTIASTQKMMDLLTDKQRVLIETEAQTRAREQQAAARAEDSTADYIVSQLQTMRGLHPEEYDALRILLALDMAEYVAFQQNLHQERVWPLARALLPIMDDVMAMSNAEFADLLPDLPAEISDRFSLPAAPPPIPARLTLGQIDDFLTNPATARLLAQTQFSQTPAPPPPLYGFADRDTATAAKRLAQVSDTRHKLEHLIDTAHILSVLYDLDISTQQIAVIATAVTSLQSAYSSAQQQWQATLNAQHAALQAVGQALATNQPLTQQQADALADLQVAEGDIAFGMLSAAAQNLQTVREALDPDQNVDIDWRPPAGVHVAEPIDERLEQLMDVASQLKDFSRFLEQVRYMEPIAYQDAATRMTRDFAARYVPPDARDFDDVVTYLIDVQTEAREVPERQWDDTVAGMIAIHAMDHLRLLPEVLSLGPPPGAQDDAPYGWWDIEHIMADPLMPGVLAGILHPAAADSTRQGEKPPAKTETTTPPADTQPQ